MTNKIDTCDLPLAGRLLRFALGTAALALFAGFFMSGVTPPGAAGEVIRHNRAMNIDASPLFYSDCERMSELEAGVREMRRQAQP
jgi:hypothetical protein